MKNLLSKKVNIILAAALVFVASAPLVIYAIDTVATGWRLEDSTVRSIEIDAHGVCHGVWNDSGTTDYFVPTKNSADWLAFRTNSPGDVTLYGCPVTDCVGEWQTDTSGGGTGCYVDTCSQAPGCNGYVNPDFTCRICNHPTTYVHTTPAQNGGLACGVPSGQTGTTNCGIEIGGATSFLAGTMVLTPQGAVAIETIDVGDHVLGSAGINTVLELKRNSHAKNVFGFNDTGLFVTGGHPFMTTEGWKAFEVEIARRINPELEIGQLIAGDFVLRSDGTKEKIINIYYEYMAVPVYNFHVTGSNDYYADGYWVHNK